MYPSAGVCGGGGSTLIFELLELLTSTRTTFCRVLFFEQTDKEDAAHKGTPYIPDFTTGIDHFCVRWN